MVYRAASDLNAYCVAQHRPAPRAGIKWFAGKAVSRTTPVSLFAFLGLVSLGFRLAFEASMVEANSGRWLCYSPGEIGLPRRSEQGNGLLIMIYATGSAIDHEVGPAVHGLLGLQGVNVTAVS